MKGQTPGQTQAGIAAYAASDGGVGEAEAKAEVAKRETRKMIYNSGVSAHTYGQALDGRDKFVDAAREARAVAEAEARKAEKARVAADAIIAKANAFEAKLERQRLARVVANKER